MAANDLAEKLEKWEVMENEVKALSEKVDHEDDRKEMAMVIMEL